MDVLKFLKSKDTREHLKKINYNFSALEAAWLVWHSDFIWDEKKKAYLEIMSEFEDMHIERETRKMTLNGSLFEYMKKYINWFEKQIFLLKDKEDNSLYSYRVYNEKGYGRLCGGFLFSTYEKLMNYLRGLDCEAQQIAKFLVKKEYLDLDECKNQIEIEFDKSLNVLIANGHEDEEENIGNSFFRSFYLDIPHPFNKGDILYNNSKCYPYRNKVVAHYINEIPEKCKKHADFSDMNVVGYVVCDDGTVDRNCCFCYMDWERWEGESDGKDDALLKIISGFLKGNVPLDEVLNVQCEVLTRHMHEKRKSNIQWMDEFHKEVYGKSKK